MNERRSTVGFFYAGLSRSKSVTSVLAHSFIAIIVVSFQWAIWGYGLSFGTGSGYIGDSEFFLMRSVNGKRAHFNAPTIPHSIYMMYELMFAIITPAIMTGAWTERLPLQTWAIFCFLWSTGVYDPVAHWVWHPNGWLFELGALDFAGGTVVHIASGSSAFVAAIMIGKRLEIRESSAGADLRPHSVPLVVLGTTLLYFGWFGFNGGSALASNGLASAAFTNTMYAAALGGAGWAFAEVIWKRKKPSLVGICSGMVCGLVAITPASGYVNPMPSLLIGASGGFVSYFACRLREKLPVDDALDAAAVHMVSGIVGCLMTGIFARKGIPGLGGLVLEGGWLSGHFIQLAYQLAAIGSVLGYASCMTFLILGFFWLPGIRNVFGIVMDDKAQEIGLDRAEHEEFGYVFGTESLSPDRYDKDFNPVTVFAPTSIR